MLSDIKMEDIENQIIKILCEMTGREEGEIKKDAHFYKDLGIDSIKGIELIVSLHQKLNIQIPDYKIPELYSVNKVAEEVKRLFIQKQPKDS